MDVPSGVEIASWFRREHERRLGAFQGCDGLSLVRDGRDYCYVWLMAYVDLDMEAYYLLDVRTSTGGTETRDFLLVFSGGGLGHCEWHQHPIETSAHYTEHRDRLRAGLRWMAETIHSESPG